MEFKTVGRDRLARELLKKGPISASDLADALGISAVAVRKHLDDMTEKSLAECHEIPPFGPAKPKGRGRPAKVYSLTPQGRDFFENQYQGLAEDSVEFINQLQGSKGVKLFAEKRASKIFEKYVSEIEKSKSLDKKVEKLTEVLTKEGFAATSDKGSGPTHTIQLCQHNCPIAHVAEKHNEFCDAELEMFNSILGVNVTRLSTIAKGGNVCTSLISTLPKTAVSSAKQYKENK
ncbi:MAG: helix-turn-helix transcriptional regulator [Candidatus Nanopelagicales bacterium]|jgi:predicted ArsR family transcriptional regulator